ncbi:hypothetical protein LFWB_3830 [Candidatus Phytoplasma luffae]|uniref:Uncharacterized protein n=1 Tax=Loofah witches'-broom phytoplasma TaxID=35773 RepID=A0A975FJJ7_LOWBP|nr:hypothetical protein [Candidatus Phytoplasma luffae]QTX02950.1 hypothetical protein LFWB_3820 [Candidatus Phytoplasma luffae]QTX02951.1 hypothetical protein LFWB_3830 [Candidatus Phytoplasma luffae]
MYNNYYKNYHKKNKYEQNIWFKWILPSIGVVVLICVFLIASGYIKLRKIFQFSEKKEEVEEKKFFKSKRKVVNGR